MAEMRLPQEFPKAFILSGPYQLSFYFLTACIGYGYKGRHASGLIVNYIPYNGWLRFTALLLFIHMIVTYLIKGNVMGRAIHRALSPKRVNEHSWRGRMEWFLINLGLLICCVILAEAIPFFDSLTGLIGALFVPIACWILPIYFFLSSPAKKKMHKLEWPLLIIILILGVLLAFVGTYSNFYDIVLDWERHGVPFSCGCQHVWNTCECSPGHTGMECT